MTEPVQRFVLDTLDGEKLALRLLRYNPLATALHAPRGATPADLAKVQAFPEVKYKKGAEAWVFPATAPCVAHLLRSWDPAEYTVTPPAKILLAYHLAAGAVADAATADRHAYLTRGVVPDVAGYLAADPPPRAHQVVAFASARTADHFGLTMEMGTGKSRVVIDVVCDRVRRARADDPAAQYRALIVAPKTVCGNWEDEFRRWATVDVNLVHLRGAPLRRVEGLVELRRDATTPVLVAVTNYEGVVVLERVAGDLFRQYGWDLIVADESIWIKNPAAKRSKALYRVGEWARSRFILTGLPITKNVEDLYGQFHFVKPGILGYNDFAAFKANFSERNFHGGAAGYNKHRLPELQERLARASFSVRRKDCVDLPPKQYVTRDIILEGEQRRAYDDMAKQALVNLDALGAAGAELTPAALPDDVNPADLGSDRFSLASVILVQLLRLAQITSGFLKLADGTLHRFDPNPKLQAVEEYLEEIDDADKVIVWSRFREDIERVAAALAPHGAVPYYGGVSDKVRAENLRRFHEDPACRVFVGQPQSAGFGINLVEASHVIYYANDFGLQTRMQSEDRAHRMGQTKSVLYVDLVAPNTIDSLVLEKIQAKRELSELLTNREEIVKALRNQLAARALLD